MKTKLLAVLTGLSIIVLPIIVYLIIKTSFGIDIIDLLRNR